MNELFEYFKSQLTNNPKNVDTCVNYGCDNKTHVALRNKHTKEVHFYCHTCGTMMAKIMPELFEIALSNRGDN